MKKIVFLGCENSHSRQFLSYINGEKKFSDIEVLGCHSELDKEAQNKLAGDFNIKALDKYDEYAGQVDGVVVTARHGGYHYQFAKPYFKNGVVAYIDKPVTISEEDAIELAELAKANNVILTGQSSLIFDENVVELRKLVNEKGVIGGFVRAPISMNNPHGGFYFYSEHLVDMVLSIFGWYPKAVKATEYDEEISVIIKYDNFEVLGLFGKDNYVYSAGLFHKEGTVMREIPVTGGEKCFKDHFDQFYDAMKLAENKTDYTQFIAPVFVLNAIERSLKSGKEETVRKYKVE